MICTSKKVSLFCNACVFLSFALFTSCGDDNESTSKDPKAVEKITTETDFFAEVCRIGEKCPDLTQEATIDECVQSVSDEIAVNDGDEIATFIATDGDRQQTVLECIETKLCDRFGTTITAISDSDVLEPLEECSE